MSYYLDRIKEILHILLSRVKIRMVRNTEPVGPEDISIIVVGRNDNYGGDFSQRLETTIDWNLKQLPGAELIYVEWNRIEDRESDCNWIEKRYPNAKCYSVSNAIHQSITSNPKMPVMEYFAKNIGMRKASREWLLMINADCLIGNDILKNIHNLNRNYVYATNYVSFKWDQKPISTAQLMNRKRYTVTFPGAPNITAAVGNFILCHKSNWMKATGYDETLTNVRAGVDANGLKQLLHLGLKPAVIGTHYHLDHAESIIHGHNATHGVHAFNNIPYVNKSGWGFNDKSFNQTSERIWQLEKI